MANPLGHPPAKTPMKLDSLEPSEPIKALMSLTVRFSSEAMFLSAGSAFFQDLVRTPANGGEGRPVPAFRPIMTLANNKGVRRV
jgi:hypothetical protein